MDHPITECSNDWCSQVFHSLNATLFSESLISEERFSYVHRELTHFLENVRNMPANDEVTLNLAPNNASES